MPAGGWNAKLARSNYMPFLVFSQANKEPPVEAVLVQKGRSFFRVELEFLRRQLAEGGWGVFHVRLTLPGR
ncbi:MAG: hypothetical protein NZX77_15930, partial [Polyangiaceae bacterium]|nr:hypothetical protein [Polyangiaceae bacterium]